MWGLIHSTLESPHLWQNDTARCLHFLPKLTALNLNVVKPPPQQRERDTPPVWIKYRNVFHHQLLKSSDHLSQNDRSLTQHSLSMWVEWQMDGVCNRRHKVASHPSSTILLSWGTGHYKYHTLMHFTKACRHKEPKTLYSSILTQ